MAIGKNDASQGRATVTLGAVLASLVAVGCTDAFSAEVTGFVVRERNASDHERGPGINSADVLIFLERPESFDSAGAVAHTTTIDNLSAGMALPGYYRASISWEEASPDYGEAGDGRTIWIAARHPEHEDRIFELQAVQSGAINLAPDIALRGLRNVAGRASGEVLMDGAGVDGVRVMLTLADSEESHEVRTQTLDGRAGVFVFDDISWDAELGDTVSATIEVVDPSYASPDALTLELTHDEPSVAREPLLVSPAFFTAQLLRGRVIDELGQGVNGVRVVLRPELARDESVRLATVSSRVGDVDGVYELTEVGWFLPGTTDHASTHDTQTVWLSVDDESYVSAGAQDELAVSVGYQQAEIEVATDLVVARRPRTQFTALVHGRCVQLGGFSPEPIAGVEVTAELSDDDGDKRVVARTDREGHFTLRLAWSNDAPASDAPSGEDEISVELSFADVVRDETTLRFETRSELVRSWIRPNHLPDFVAHAETADAGSDEE